MINIDSLNYHEWYAVFSHAFVEIIISTLSAVCLAHVAQVQEGHTRYDQISYSPINIGLQKILKPIFQ